MLSQHKVQGMYIRQESDFVTLKPSPGIFLYALGALLDSLLNP